VANGLVNANRTLPAGEDSSFARPSSRARRRRGRRCFWSREPATSEMFDRPAAGWPTGLSLAYREPTHHQVIGGCGISGWYQSTSTILFSRATSGRSQTCRDDDTLHRIAASAITGSRIGFAGRPISTRMASTVSRLSRAAVSRLADTVFTMRSNVPASVSKVSGSLVA
jgi:hypothetical protein